MSRPIVFSHANGFPARSYRKFFHCLRKGPINHINIYGAGKFPIGVNWRGATDELIDFTERNFQQPVIALGHSFGAAISLFAAARRPELFEQIIAVDPPLFGKRKRWPVGLMRLLGVDDYGYPLPLMAQKRRNIFDSKHQALEYFKQKPLFKRFDPQCLEDYVQHALIKRANRFELAISPEMESNIFRFFPCFFFPQLTQLKSSNILYSTNPPHFDQHDLAWLQKHLPSVNLMPYDGGHLAMLEAPMAMARSIACLLKTQRP